MGISSRIKNNIYIKKSLGKDGKIIDVYKIKTMHDDAESKLVEYIQKGGEFDTYGKINNDPRIIKSREKIRKNFLDEIPQFINVFVKKDMKLVGIRPKSHIDWSKAPENLKLNAIKYKPGLIGVPYAFKNIKTFRQKLLCEELYLKSCNNPEIGKNITDTIYFTSIVYNTLIRGKRSS